MTLDELGQTTGEWLGGTGPMADVVVSSRVRLARNLADHAFLSTAAAGERAEIFRRLTDEITALPFGQDALVLNMDETDAIDCDLLVERHLVSRQHVTGEGARGVTISADETQSLMINEEDHLRIQGLRCGLQLDDIWQELDGIDDALGAQVPFAYDRKLGYLTACPTNVGTGIRVSVMLHLPGVKLTNELERVARAARDLRLAVRGLYGEGTEAVGDFYQVSNQITLGKSEEDIIKAFSETIIPQIVAYERAARKSLASQGGQQLDDLIWRAYGVLCHARTISSAETQTLLSPIRAGIHMGRFDRFDLATLNELFLYTQPAHLQKRCGRTLSGEERAIARADYLRQRISSG